MIKNIEIIILFYNIIIGESKNVSPEIRRIRSKTSEISRWAYRLRQRLVGHPVVPLQRRGAVLSRPEPARPELLPGHIRELCQRNPAKSNGHPSTQTTNYGPDLSGKQALLRLIPSRYGSPFLLVDRINSKFSENTANRFRISSALP